MHYRKEIDGLRAIAVLAVMFFHAGFSLVPGGFLGVDLFFVISGYLITSLIFLEIHQSKFSLLNFYERRARRLLPALFLMMLACIPLAVFMMQPDDLQNFGQSLISTSLMSNNILLYLTSGYWDITSEFKPLLHTWSLGVEEQYYLIFPLMALLVCKLSSRKILSIFMIITIGSFLFSSWIQQIDPDADFYLLPSRIWELGVGALIAFFLIFDKDFQTSLTYRAKEFISLTGMGLVMIPIIFFHSTPELLNYFRLMVVVGTGALILCADNNTFLGTFLSSKLLVYVGLMSYSLYLLHQPLFAFLRIGSISEPATSSYLMMMAITFIAAYFSLKVEHFFRDHQKISSKKFISVLIFSLTVCLASGLVFTQTYGFYRSYPELESSYSLKDNPEIINPDKHFLISANQNLDKNFLKAPATHKKLVVMGDSFSSDFINMGKANSFFNNVTLVKPKYNCFNHNDIDDESAELILESDFIIITYRLLAENLQRECLQRKISFIQSNHKAFILIGPKDFGYNINAPLRNKMYSYHAKPSHDVELFNTYLQGLVHKEQFIDLIKLIGDDERKVPLFTDSHKLISYDRAHLTYNGAKTVGKQLFQHPALRGFQ